MLLDTENLVERNRFLVGLKSPGYTAGELQILDTYLSRINIRDRSTKVVTFTKEEYEDLIGVTKIRISALKKYTESLLSKVVTIPDGNDGYKQYTLFSTAVCEKNDITKSWTIKLKCNDDLEDLFFDVDMMGYLRYQLKNTLNMSSKYSILLYYLLKDNVYRGTVNIPFAILKEKLNVTVDRYEQYKFFNQEILKKCQKEINECTDIFFEYNKIMNKKTVESIQFQISEKISRNINVKEIEDFTIETIADSVSDGTYSEPVTLNLIESNYFEKACNFEFDAEEITILYNLVAKIIPYTLETNDIREERYLYIREKYNYMQIKSRSKTAKEISDRFAFMKDLLYRDLAIIKD